jgi:exodeoxyribonuclease-3
MTKLKLATWNVASVRAHMDVVERFVTTCKPHVLCLQETKVRDDQFPLAPFRKWGYRLCALHGQAGYHGVAVLAKPASKLVEPNNMKWAAKDDARHIHCRIADDVELHNFYVPAGGDIPDPKVNDKFAHKLDFLRETTQWFATHRDPGRRAILVGDLNIAPLETDVWNHKQLLKIVSHTPVEVEALGRLQASHDWIDAVREFVPPEQKLYSWWSYRAKDWAAADKGRRLDHIWITRALRPALKKAYVVKEARGWPTPSDHAPVVAEFDI